MYKNEKPGLKKGYSRSPLSLQARVQPWSLIQIAIYAGTYSRHVVVFWTSGNLKHKSPW